jgi:hypothetical protein
MNHRRPRDTSWSYDDTMQAFTVRSLREMALGEEVFDSYGKKCNSRYLLNYGFTVLDNTGSCGFPFLPPAPSSLCSDDDGTCYNQCCLEIGLNPSDPILERKMERLDEISKATESSHRLVRLSLHLDDPETINAFCYARFICASVRQYLLSPHSDP